MPSSWTPRADRHAGPIHAPSGWPPIVSASDEKEAARVPGLLWTPVGESASATAMGVRTLAVFFVAHLSACYSSPPSPEPEAPRSTGHEAPAPRHESAVPASEAPPSDAEPITPETASNGPAPIAAGTSVPWAVASPASNHVHDPWSSTSLRFNPGQAAALAPDEATVSMELQRRTDELAACEGPQDGPYVLRELRNPCINAFVQSLDPSDAYHLVVVWEGGSPTQHFALRQDRTHHVNTPLNAVTLGPRGPESGAQNAFRFLFP